MGGRSLGPQFGWLWAAYIVSAVGTSLAFDAFSLIAVLVLHAGSTEVSVLAAAGLAVGAAVAVPLGPWMEFRRKRPVMVTMDLVRFGALMTVPVAYVLGWLTFVQLLVVSVIVAAADIAFKAASGACVKMLVSRENLIIANGRLESTTWTATSIGPPLGGFAIGLLGPVATMVIDAVSYLLSALGIRAIRGEEPHPAGTGGTRLRKGDLVEGWRYILTHPMLRPLFLNSVLVGGLIMATAPLMAVLMLGHLGFAPWQYGLAFGVPCIGGLIGSRIARRLVVRYGQYKIILVAGVLRTCWSIGLAFVQPGVPGLVLVMTLQFGLVTCMGVFSPAYSTYRLEKTASDRVARTLSAWSVTSKVSIAALTALWGLLAQFIGLRVAVAAAGVLLMATSLLIPRHDRAPEPDRHLAATH